MKQHVDEVVACIPVAKNLDLHCNSQRCKRPVRVWTAGRATHARTPKVAAPAAMVSASLLREEEDGMATNANGGAQSNYLVFHQPARASQPASQPTKEKEKTRRQRKIANPFFLHDTSCGFESFSWERGGGPES